VKPCNRPPRDLGAGHAARAEETGDRIGAIAHAGTWSQKTPLHGGSDPRGNRAPALVARPLVERVGFTLLFALVLDLALVAIPGAPPVRSTLELSQSTLELGAIVVFAALQAVAAIAVGGLLCWAFAVLARRRS